MHKLILLTAALVVFPAADSQATDFDPALPAKDDFMVFLLAGQSNMAGRGEITPEDLEVHPRILMLGRDGNWQFAVDPVHFDKKQAGTGLAKSFARQIAAAYPDATVGLVPAACGGSSINTWVPGGYHDQTDSHPYDDAIARTRRALRDGVLAGILWHQGESDSRPARAAKYEENLAELIRRFRKDLDAPDLPFIIGQLGQFEAKPWTDARRQVNEAQETVAREVPYSDFVPSAGLTSKGDNTHFDSRSLHEFGRRYARAWLNLVEEAD